MFVFVIRYLYYGLGDHHTLVVQKDYQTKNSNDMLYF